MAMEMAKISKNDHLTMKQHGNNLRLYEGSNAWWWNRRLYPNYWKPNLDVYYS